MKTEHIVMIVAVAVLSAAALAGVIYGVTTHEEPGFVADMEPTTEPGMTSGRWTAEDPPLWICPRAYAANPLSDADAEALASDWEAVIGALAAIGVIIAVIFAFNYFIIRRLK